MININRLVLAVLLPLILTPLRPAIAQGKKWWIEEIERRIQHAAPDSIVLMDQPALFLAADAGRLDLVEKLVEKGADINHIITVEDHYPDRSKWKPSPLQSGWMEYRETAHQAAHFDPRSYPHTALMAAARSGHSQVVAFLLEKGVDPGVKNGAGDTALTLAMKSGDAASVALLMQKAGAAASSLNEDLVTAAAGGHAKLIGVLLDNGADVNTKNKYGTTALMAAAHRNQKDAVTVLIQRGADINASVERIKGRYDTPLFFALEAGFPEVAEIIHREGPSIKSFDDIHCAVTANDASLLTALLDRGAPIEERNVHGVTALQLAAYQGRVEIASLLIARKAVVDVYDGMDRSSLTPLMLATKSGNVQMVSLLLASGADIDLSNRAGITALKLAISEKNPELVRLLLGKGAHVATGSWGEIELAKQRSTQEIVALLETALQPKKVAQSALFAAIESGDVTRAELALFSGAPVSEYPEGATFPLFLAIKKGNLHIVRLLLAKGASAGSRIDNDFPLILAARGGHNAILKELLQQNLFLDEKDRARTTALIEAARRGNREMAVMLMEKGADLDVRDGRGSSAEDYARAGKYSDVVAAITTEREARKNGLTRKKNRPDGIFDLEIN